MFTDEEILKLQDERQRLLVESELNRRAFSAAASQLGHVQTWVQAGARSLHLARPLLLTLAPILGYLLARRCRPVASPATSTPGLVGKGLLAWQLLRKLYFVWQFLQKRLR